MLPFRSNIPKKFFGDKEEQTATDIKTQLNDHFMLQFQDFVEGKRPLNKEEIRQNSSRKCSTNTTGRHGCDIMNKADRGPVKGWIFSFSLRGSLPFHIPKQELNKGRRKTEMFPSCFLENANARKGCRNLQRDENYENRKQKILVAGAAPYH